MHRQVIVPWPLRKDTMTMFGVWLCLLMADTLLQVLLTTQFWPGMPHLERLLQGLSKAKSAWFYLFVFPQTLPSSPQVARTTKFDYGTPRQGSMSWVL